MKLPRNHAPYTDKYFLRANQVLSAEQLNPIVIGQVFLRDSGTIHGLDDTCELFKKYAPQFFTNGGKLLRLKDGAPYEPLETVLMIQGHIQDFVELETMYLGIIAAETTLHNDKQDIDLAAIEERAAKIVRLMQPRPLLYFGARHWRFDRDADIAEACFKGGASECSTDIGAKYKQREGVGTIPHVLENIFAWKYGPQKAVLETMLAYHRAVDRRLPRIALVDYYNREIEDTLSVCQALKTSLYGVRVDTCGENVMQGAVYGGYNKPNDWWGQKGVSISGVTNLVSILLSRVDSGYPALAIPEMPKIFLSGGFANPDKVQAFIEAEKRNNIRLFDALGVGQLYHSRAAKMDITHIGDTPDQLVPICKVGREFLRPNLHRLRQVT